MAEASDVLAEEEQEAVIEALELQASGQSRMWRRCFAGFGVVLSAALVRALAGRLVQRSPCACRRLPRSPTTSNLGK